MNLFTHILRFSLLLTLLLCSQVCHATHRGYVAGEVVECSSKPGDLETRERFTKDFLSQLDEIHHKKIGENPVLVDVWAKFKDELDLETLFKKLPDGGNFYTKFDEVFGDGNGGLGDPIKVKAFLEDVSASGNQGLLDLFKTNPDLIKVWDRIKTNNNVPDALRRDPEYLKIFDQIDKNEKAKKHIFYGEISASGSVGGVHHISAINSGSARIVPGTRTDDPNGSGLYEAKVEVKDDNGIYQPKLTNRGGYSTFFPDSWNQQKVLEEIAYAYKNRIPVSGNIFEGTSIDGLIKIQMYLRSDKSIISAFPVF